MDFKIENLGEGAYKNQITLPANKSFTQEDQRMARNPYLPNIANCEDDLMESSFELAGPREKQFFKPDAVKAAIVTCGGLCPGINAVIRAIVHQLRSRYGCTQVSGIPYGYQGFNESAPKQAIDLTMQVVANIHQRGGSFLGSSRGTPGAKVIVDYLEKNGINMLFTIGGDGTMRGALGICDEINKRNLKISVIGIPKTIDNDIPFVRRSFGFETAVGLACQAVESAYVEAIGGYDCIGLVRLMGRNSGYIAASATLATGQADFCLVPEIPFSLEGENGLFAEVERTLNKKGHALIVVAEGAGQEYFAEQLNGETDPSGNKKFGDIGLFLKKSIQDYFKSKERKTSLKYIDPSYIVRSAPANPGDRLFCTKLAQNAVHAAMAGKTSMIVGYWHGALTHVPLKMLAGKNQSISPEGELWLNVLESTGQLSALK